MGAPAASQDDDIKLYVWGGGWGLPSIDPASLQCLVSFFIISINSFIKPYTFNMYQLSTKTKDCVGNPLFIFTLQSQLETCHPNLPKYLQVYP